MILSELEQETLLTLFKNPFENYNSSTLAQVLKKSRMGVFKAFNNLERNNLVAGKTLGKARFYRLTLDNEYTRKTLELLLMDESKKYVRWKDEFKEIGAHVKILILFGSIIHTEKNAGDIDIMIVYDKKDNEIITKIIKEKNNVLTKKIHPVKQTLEDIRSNILKKDKIILSAIKEGIVLTGQDEFVGLMHDVAGEK